MVRLAGCYRAKHVCLDINGDKDATYNDDIATVNTSSDIGDQNVEIQQ